MVWLLIRLARTRDLLRDLNGGWRPDGRRTLSLSRLQMAVWTLGGCALSFSFGLSLPRADSVNNTALGLIQFGAGPLPGPQ